MSRVSVVGAAGRVGFPLSLVLANNNHIVCGIDKNQVANRLISSGKNPYVEQGAEE